MMWDVVLEEFILSTALPTCAQHYLALWCLSRVAPWLQRARSPVLLWKKRLHDSIKCNLCTSKNYNLQVWSPTTTKHNMTDIVIVEEFLLKSILTTFHEKWKFRNKQTTSPPKKKKIVSLLIIRTMYIIRLIKWEWLLCFNHIFS